MRIRICKRCGREFERESNSYACMCPECSKQAKKKAFCEKGLAKYAEQLLWGIHVHFFAHPVKKSGNGNKNGYTISANHQGILIALTFVKLAENHILSKVVCSGIAQNAPKQKYHKIYLPIKLNIWQQTKRK